MSVTFYVTFHVFYHGGCAGVWDISHRHCMPPGWCGDLCEPGGLLFWLGPSWGAWGPAVSWPHSGNLNSCALFSCVGACQVQYFRRQLFQRSTLKPYPLWSPNCVTHAVVANRCKRDIWSHCRSPHSLPVEVKTCVNSSASRLPQTRFFKAWELHVNEFINQWAHEEKFRSWLRMHSLHYLAGGSCRPMFRIFYRLSLYWTSVRLTYLLLTTYTDEPQLSCMVSISFLLKFSYLEQIWCIIWIWYKTVQVITRIR